MLVTCKLDPWQPTCTVGSCSLQPPNSCATSDSNQADGSWPYTQRAVRYPGGADVSILDTGTEFSTTLSVIDWQIYTDNWLGCKVLWQRLESAVTKDHHCFSLQRPPKRRHNCASGARMDAHLGWQSASKRWLSEPLFLASRFLAQWFLSVLPSIQLQQRNVMPNWPAVSVCGRRRKPWAAVSFDCGRCGSAERSKHARGIAHGSQVASKPFEHIPRAQSPSKFTLENYSECLMEVCCALEVRVHTV
jgi:hypothetical protein